MKKFCLLILALCAFTAQAATVTGKIVGKPTYSVVSLSAFSANGSFDFVTSRVVNTDGSFSFSIPATQQNYYHLNFTDGRKLNRPIFLVVSPNDQIELTLQSDLSSLYISQVKGSAEVSFIAQYQGLTVQLMQTMQGFEQDYALAKTDAEKQVIQNQFNRIYTQHLLQSEALLQANTQYLAAAFLAYSEFGTQIGQHKPLFQALYNQLAPAHPHDAVLAAIKEGLTNPIAIGNKAPEIVMKGWDGQTYTLSSLRGKYVLVDFWASWCRPCRAENPNVVKAYQAFHSKGLEIFSVSLDNSQEKWKAAVAADGLVWPYHGSTLQGWQCPLAQAYHVSSIPFSVLVDPNGIIIGISLRGEELQQKLSQLLQ